MATQLANRAHDTSETALHDLYDELHPGSLGARDGRQMAELIKNYATHQPQRRGNTLGERRLCR